MADIHKPERCDKLKDTYEPDAVKIFAGASSPRIVIAQKDAPELLVWDLAARKLEQTIRWPGQDSAPNVIGVSHDLKSVAVAEPGSSASARWTPARRSRISGALGRPPAT